MSHGQVDHALLIFRRHFCEAEEETRLIPNEVIFNTLLDGCVKNNRLELVPFFSCEHIVSFPKYNIKFCPTQKYYCRLNFPPFL